MFALDPDFCETRCPICTRARKGYRLSRLLQRIETLLTFGGCPWGRARQQKYGVRPNEPRPENEEAARERACTRTAADR